ADMLSPGRWVAIMPNHRLRRLRRRPVRAVLATISSDGATEHGNESCPCVAKVDGSYRTPRRKSDVDADRSCDSFSFSNEPAFHLSGHPRAAVMGRARKRLSRWHEEARPSE